MRASIVHLSLLCVTVACVVTTAAQSNSGSTNAPARPRSQDVWEYSDQLGLTPEQQKTMDEIRIRYQAAQAKLREAKQPGATPDMMTAAQQNYAVEMRSAQKRIGELLTPEQKKKFVALRGAVVSPRVTVQDTRTNASPRAIGTNVPAPRGSTNAPATTPTTNPPPFTLITPRASLSDEEYRKLAGELRVTYSKPATNWPAPTIDAEVKSRYVELGLLPLVKYPTNNPYSEAKAELGKKLYFDPRLSGSGQIACASCHEPELGWSDGRTVSFGHARTQLKRNAQTLNNVGHEKLLFWDGRADSLEQQVIDVVTNEDEMRSDAKGVRERLGRVPGYTNEFAKVFGTPEITLERAAQAVATFERGIVSRASAFDTFLRGDTNAMSDSAVRGLHLFHTTARCVNCHHGPTFSDGLFHNEGLTYYGRELQDLGRYNVTKKADDVGAFKTPTLRNITRTGPYMHNGLFDLDGVLRMYNGSMPNVRRKESQMNDPLFPKKSHLLHPLGLNDQDFADLKGFLESLTETRLRIRPPELPADLAAKAGE